jgi:hypothetical protein
MSFAMITAVAQQDRTINGYVRDAETGEELIHATVIVQGTTVGVATNPYGFFSLTLIEGDYKIRVSYLGYTAKEIPIQLDRNIRLEVDLEPESIEVNEVVITGKREDENVTGTEMSVLSLDVREVRAVPVILGEQDILKTVQLLPGVSPSSEGSSGFTVRGGNFDQNLILLDEAPVYNASHLLGFFSVFNSDALKDVTLYKGSPPALYGGRLSSVLDIRMKNGNARAWDFSGGVGLISSRLTVEGPIVDGLSSFIVSGRRTYLDLIVKTADPDLSELDFFFYDLNAKMNYHLSEDDRIFISGYTGRDVFGVEEVGIDWGNITFTMRWNHIFTEALFSNFSVLYSDFNYGFKFNNAGTVLRLSSGIFDYTLKNDFSWYANSDNLLSFGWNLLFHKFEPGDFSVEDTVQSSDFSIPRKRALESAVYVSNEQKLGPLLTLEYGFRISSFSNIGPQEVRTYDDRDSVSATAFYAEGDFFNTYTGVEPRFHATYLLDDLSSLKFSLGRSYQYLHVLSNATASAPTDVWAPSSPLIKPGRIDQVSFGYFRNFERNEWELSTELYYRSLAHQIDFEDGASPFLNPDIEAELEFGEGEAYGLELLVRKQKGSLTGWLSYTLSSSRRLFPGLNKGRWFSTRQDRTHDISFVARYQLSPRLAFSSTWIYYTGDAVTFPTGKYRIDGAIVNLYSGRNGDRMPAYHRLDIGLTVKLNDGDDWQSELAFSIYNAYNRFNAYSINFRESETNPGTTEAVKLSLFGFVPAITWNFRF